MKVGVIVPDRGDRPLFLENCKRMIKAQTLQPFFVHINSDAPKDNDYDIVPRIRKMYNNISATQDLLNIDMIAIMENDDWYSPKYLETMMREWDAHGRPDLFGTTYTIYYHLKLKAYFTMEHYQRSSLMSTFIKPGLNFNWPVDIEPYLDMHLWEEIPFRVVMKPKEHITIGMKHNVGKCGGWSHDANDAMTIARFENKDNGLLESTLDPESFKFYSNYFA